MDRRVIFGLIAVVIGLSLFFLAFSQKEQALTCVSGDGFCPNGCTYPQDLDCSRSTITTSGEIRRCTADTDCVIVEPICGNANCNFNDAECLSSCSCGVAINKDYENVFKNTNTVCTPSGIACTKCPDTSPSSVCINGECRMQSIS